jgi:hypothetical protein
MIFLEYFYEVTSFFITQCLGHFIYRGRAFFNGVQINGIENGVFSIRLRSMTGQLQQSRSVTVTHNLQTEFLDAKSGVTTGTYLVTVYDGKGLIIATNKVLVQ